MELVFEVQPFCCVFSAGDTFRFRFFCYMDGLHMRESTVTWKVLGDWEGRVDEKDKLVCLNFKVPLQILKRFQIHAASQKGYHSFHPEEVFQCADVLPARSPPCQ
jgi:hypothetical protein